MVIQGNPDIYRQSDGIFDGTLRIFPSDTVMALTNLKVQKAKPRARQYKLADERGMYLLIPTPA